MFHGFWMNHPLIAYEEALALQLQWVEAKQKADFQDLLVLLEHTPVITLGRRGKEEHLRVSRDFLDREGIGLIRCQRGGDITYHGPGQLVGYPILEIRKFGLRIKDYVRQIEEVLIRTLADFEINGYRKEGFPGVWTGGKKIASIGIAFQKGITFHGFALNYATNQAHFNWIIPCGLDGVRMTSLQELKGGSVDSGNLRNKIRVHFEKVFDIRLQQIVMKDLKGMLEMVQVPNKKLHITNTISPNFELRTPKPSWLKKRIPPGLHPAKVKNLISGTHLHTVCQEARCPNQGECFGKGSATFLLMGDRCTRNCSFCAVNPGLPAPLDGEEPLRIAKAVETLGISYAVLTSVTRDDLPDGGADHFIKVIETLRNRSPKTKIECLIPDFQGVKWALDHLGKAAPEVINHNMETISRLYPSVRPEAGYGRSLALLNYFKQNYPSILTKSGFMIGLGESRTEIRSLLQDLYAAGCEMVTIGQYLQPTPDHLPVSRYVTPDEFNEWLEEALNVGFLAAASGPFVRSSYKAEELYNKARRKGEGQ